MSKVSSVLSCLALAAFAGHAGLGLGLVWPVSLASLVLVLCLADILASLSSWAEVEVVDRQPVDARPEDADIEFRLF